VFQLAEEMDLELTTRRTFWAGMVNELAETDNNRRKITFGPQSCGEMLNRFRRDKVAFVA
jgi:hypothetical protein